MKLARRIHMLLGVLFAPLIVTFALTGACMAVGLLSTRDGRTPPKWLVHFSEIHKHQRWEPRKRAAPPPTAPAAAAVAGSAPAQPAAPQPRKRLGTTLLQGFVVLMAGALVATTALGVWMSWLVPRDRKLVVALLALGALLPAAFLLF